MKLKQFYNKKVEIEAENGRFFAGYVSEYFYPENNDNKKESIVVDTDGAPIEFFSADIKAISIVESN